MLETINQREILIVNLWECIEYCELWHEEIREDLAFSEMRGDA